MSKKKIGAWIGAGVAALIVCTATVWGISEAGNSGSSKYELAAAAAEDRMQLRIERIEGLLRRIERAQRVGKQSAGSSPAPAPAKAKPPRAQTSSTPPPEPKPAPTEETSCDPSYEGACLDPTASDYDCEGGSGDGPEYTGEVAVVGDDHYGLDRDGDGVACEPY